MAITGADFTTYHGFHHWEGCGQYDEYCSEDGFETEGDAVNNAIAFLQSLVDADSSEPDVSALIN